MPVAPSFNARTRSILFLLALAVKGLFLIWLLDPSGVPPGALAHIKGDVPSYLDPIDSFIAGHGYSPDYRMPGYGVVYFFLRCLLAPQAAQNALVIAQVIVDAATCLLLALLVLRLTRSRTTAFVAFGLYVTSLFVTNSDKALTTEAFVVCSLLLALYMLARAMDVRSHAYLLGAGAAIAWAIFLKPFYVLLLPIMAMWLFFHGKAGKRSAFVEVIFFLAPFVVVDAAWAYRNYRVHDRFAPLTNGIYYAGIENGPKLPIFQFIQAFGGRIDAPAPEAEVRYFHTEDFILGPQDVALPPWVTTSRYSMDSLSAVADDMAKFVGDTLATSERAALEASIKQRMISYRASFIAEHPWRYHVYAPLRLTRSFLVHTGLPALFKKPFAQLSWWQKIIKLLTAIQFEFIALGGLLVAVVLPFRRSAPMALRWISAMTVIGVFTLPLVLRLSEFRYLQPMYPWLLILSVTGAADMLRWLKKRRTGKALDW